MKINLKDSCKVTKKENSELLREIKKREKKTKRFDNNLNLKDEHQENVSKETIKEVGNHLPMESKEEARSNFTPAHGSPSTTGLQVGIPSELSKCSITLPTIAVLPSSPVASPPPLALCSSPRTPPGTPPGTPSCKASPTSPSLLTLDKVRRNPIIELKEKIAITKPSFEELLEIVKNSKMPFEYSDYESEYEDVKYKDVDSENWERDYGEIDEC